MRPLRRTTQSQKKNTRCLSNIALLNNVVMDPNCAHLHLHTIFPASDALPWRDTFSTQYSVQVALKKNSIPKSVKLITCMVSSYNLPTYYQNWQIPLRPKFFLSVSGKPNQPYFLPPADHIFYG